MLKIYGRANSINVRKVLWIADELGLAYQREDWGRGFKPLSDPSFKALNPMGGIPVIDDDGFILRESNVIVRYLADKHQRVDLYPTDPKLRYPIDAWMDWAGSDLYWGVRPVFLASVVSPPPYDAKTVEAGAKEWINRMQLLESHLATTNAHLMGEAFTIADIPAGLVVNRWFMVDFAKPELPAVRAYYDRLAARPAYMLHGRNGTA